MKVKAWISRLKQWASRLLELMAQGSGAAPGGKNDDRWRYYTGFFE